LGLSQIPPTVCPYKTDPFFYSSQEHLADLFGLNDSKYQVRVGAFPNPKTVRPES